MVSSCSNIQLLWSPAALIFSCCGLQLLWYSAALIFSCCGLQLLWYPTAVVSSCSDIQLPWPPAALISSCHGLQLLWYPASIVSSCYDIQLPLVFSCHCPRCPWSSAAFLALCPHSTLKPCGISFISSSFTESLQKNFKHVWSGQKEMNGPAHNRTLSQRLEKLTTDVVQKCSAKNHLQKTIFFCVWKLRIKPHQRMVDKLRLPNYISISDSYYAFHLELTFLCVRISIILS